MPSPTHHHRARIAALSRSRAHDDPELRAEYAALAEQRIAQYIERTAATIAPLTPEARTRLAVLLLAQSNAAPKDAA